MHVTSASGRSGVDSTGSPCIFSLCSLNGDDFKCLINLQEQKNYQKVRMYGEKWDSKESLKLVKHLML